MQSGVRTFKPETLITESRIDGSCKPKKNIPTEVKGMQYDGVGAFLGWRDWCTKTEDVRRTQHQVKY